MQRYHATSVQCSRPSAPTSLSRSRPGYLPIAREGRMDGEMGSRYRPLRLRHFRRTGFMEYRAGSLDQSGLMLAAWITLLHFSVSAVQYAPNSAGLKIVGMIVNSARRALILWSASPALVSRLSFSMIAVGVPRGTPMPVHVSAS